jgi:hypothetical protein
MSTATLAPPNAILFLFDRGNNAVAIPEYVDGQLVVSNASCVSVGTQAAVDGEVTISLESKTPSAPATGLQKVFSGILHAPSRKLAVVTAEDRTVLECVVSSGTPEVEVWTDDVRSPARIAVIAS